MCFIMELSKLNDSDIKDFSSKARNLVILKRNGVNIPKSWVIKKSCLIKQLIDYGIEVTSEGIAIERVNEINNFFKHIPESFIKQLYKEVEVIKQNNKNIKGFAIRSSGEGEDGIVSSFAGQYISILNKHAIGNIVCDILKCWKHSVSYEIVEYANINNVKYIKPCDLILQQFIQAKCGGVLLKSDGNFYISGNWGAVQSVVDGFSITDNWYISKNSSIEATINKKNFAVVSSSIRYNHMVGETIKCVEFPNNPQAIVERCSNTENLITVRIPDEMAIIPSVSNEEILLLIKIADKVSNFIEIVDYDVEWCFNSKCELYILQIRPVSRKIDTNLHIKHTMDTFRGIGLVDGIAEGKLCYVESEKDAMAFNKGDILCAKRLIGCVLHAAQKASGCIVESDSILSHSAIIARELGIPAIGVRDIKVLDTSKFCRINGRKGSFNYISKEDIIDVETHKYKFAYDKNTKNEILCIDEMYFNTDMDGFIIEKEY